jgi:hypothetical protein
MVPQIGPPPDEGHRPAAGLAVQDEHDSRLAGAFSELAPALDRPEQTFEAAGKVAHPASSKR